MKTKTSLWLSIATLVLCLGVMTFGVYSALSATISINGSLGFNMHNCMVTVSGSIQNIAVTKTGSNFAKKTDKEIEGAIMGSDSNTVASIDLGDMYFFYGSYTDPDTGVESEQTYDIIFELTFTNIGETSITATIPLPTVGDGITLIHGDTNADYTDLTNYSKKIAKNSSKTIVFALNLTDATKLSQKVSFAWNNITFEEYEGPEYFYTISDGTAYDDYLATKIGTYNETAIEWVAFAVKGTGTNCATKPTFLENETVYSLAFDDDGDDVNEATWYSLSGVDMSDKDYANHTFWFIQRDVTMEYAGEYSQLNSYLNSTYINTIRFNDAELFENNNLIKREKIREVKIDPYRTDKPFNESDLWLMGISECFVLMGSEIHSGQNYSGLCIVSQDWWLSTYYDNSPGGHIEPSMGYCSMPSEVYSVILPENSMDNSAYIRPAFMLKINEI